MLNRGVLLAQYYWVSLRIPEFKSRTLRYKTSTCKRSLFGYPSLGFIIQKASTPSVELPQFCGFGSGSGKGESMIFPTEV